MKTLPVIQDRTCGSCTLCCKLLSVDELGKPVGQWCERCDPKVGCGIYPDRPQSCRDFTCLWLQGGVPEHWRPDKLRAVLWPEPGEGSVIMISEDPKGPESHKREPLAGWMDTLQEKGVVFVVIRGQARRVYGRPDDVRRTLKARGADPKIVEQLATHLQGKEF